MPFISIEWFPGRTREQKEKLAEAITKAMVELGNAPADQTWIVFREESKDNWSMAGKLAG
ncbi:MAG: 4-oxalocrotonate tautomerase family protein [Chloroflexi bacterium]|nr:4-oxalocrotonate tautomerase family protein [Chloroflexota bacterium]